MVGLALSACLIMGVMQFFLDMKQHFVRQQALARLQENARIVSVLLGRAVQSNGQMGCNRLGRGLSLYVHPPLFADELGLPNVMGVKRSFLKQNSHVVKAVTDRMQVKSDVLWVRTLKKSHQVAHIADSFLWVQGHLPVKDGEHMILADCERADLFKIRAPFEKMTKISVPHLSKHYGTEAVIGHFASLLYYVGKTQRKNDRNQPIYALYVTDLNGRTQELVAGVACLKLLYGVKKQNKLVYLLADEIDNWTEVIGIKCHVLLTSIEAVLPAARPYFYNEKPIRAPDRLLRQWVTYAWAC